MPNPLQMRTHSYSGYHNAWISEYLGIQKQNKANMSKNVYIYVSYDQQIRPTSHIVHEINTLSESNMLQGC